MSHQLQHFDYHIFISWIKTFKRHSFEELQTKSPFKQPSTILFELEQNKKKKSLNSNVKPKRLPTSPTPDKTPVITNQTTYNYDADPDESSPRRNNHHDHFF